MLQNKELPIPEGSDGYALVLVLIGVAILSILVESALLISSQSVQHVSTDLVRARLDWAVRAGMTEAVLSLMDERPSMQWPVDGTPRDVPFNDTSVQVQIESEYGKIDLNNAQRPLLLGLFGAAGLDQTDASILADRVMDWREPGNFKRLNGAKTADYRAAGIPYGPRGGPFQSIDELNLVIGMTPDLYAQVQPGITVYNVLPSPQLESAPPIVLRSTGMDPASIDTIMALRAKGEVAPSNGYLEPSSEHRIIGLPMTVFTIDAAATFQGIRVTHTEIIRFTGNSQDPFWVLAWH